MAEIVVALVVMAIVAAVVVPITKDKFEKADYASYYLGYKTIQNIRTEIMPKIVEVASETEEEPVTFELNGTRYRAPFRPSPHYWNDCNMSGVTTDPEDLAFMQKYGITYCLRSSFYNDYWAGAVKTCGGVSNMPSMAQIAQIANYIYETNSISVTGKSYNLTMNQDKLTSLGFSLNSANTLSIYSKEEYSASTAMHMNFELTSTTGIQYGRNNASYSICLATDSEDEEPVSYITQFCENISKDFNVPETFNTCDGISTDLPQAISTKDFSFVNPNLTLTNGLKIYIASDYGEIEALNDSLDEDDRVGFVVYVDVDGRRSKTRLYDDVFPFYLTKSGKVIPGYDSSTVAGANCEKNLAFNILYDEFDASGNRKLKRLDGTSIDGADMYSFKNAACISGYVKSQKYCGISFDGSLTINGVNCKNDEQADCRIQVRKPLKIFH